MQVFPLIKKYGGAVVIGLTLDEDGIPADSRRTCGRLPEKIIT